MIGIQNRTSQFNLIPISLFHSVYSLPFNPFKEYIFNKHSLHKLMDRDYLPSSS